MPERRQKQSQVLKLHHSLLNLTNANYSDSCIVLDHICSLDEKKEKKETQNINTLNDNLIIF